MYSILVVDDEPLNRDVATRRLQREGYHVTVAENGMRACELMEVELFDLVLLDLNMPRMSGYDVLEWVREQAGIDSKIIVLTAARDRDSVTRSLQRGAHDYLVKSAGTPELLNRIRRLCTLRQLEAAQPDGISERQMQAARILVVEDQRTTVELLLTRLKNADLSARGVTDGGAALAALAETPCDLLLLDYHLPDMTGLAVIEQLREHYPTEELAIVLVTGEADRECIDACYAAGADDYVSKPFHAADLLNRVKNALRLKFMRQQARDNDPAARSLP
ncbi:MAG TPA: response regulator [Gammaproteobacteria bacterium]|nr:response regulator [Gammaproteobacteria bacterium]